MERLAPNLNMSGNVVTSPVPEGILSGAYYFGINYGVANTSFYSGSGTTIDVGSSQYTGLANVGFFGVISSSPIVNSPTTGTFSVFGAFDSVQIGDVLYAQGPGISPSNPLYPDPNTGMTMTGPSSGCNGFFCSFFHDVESVGAAVVGQAGVYTYGGYFDPAGANAYTYETLNGALFTSVGDFPSGFSSEFDVSSGGTDYGLFGPGQTLKFPGAGVTSFTISGINPTFDGSNPIAFPVDIALNENNADVEAIAFDQAVSPTPEPASISLCVAAGLMLFGVGLRKRPRN